MRPNAARPRKPDPVPGHKGQAHARSLYIFLVNNPMSSTPIHFAKSR
jgi:hypothetical protein